MQPVVNKMMDSDNDSSSVFPMNPIENLLPSFVGKGAASLEQTLTMTSTKELRLGKY